jgi:hypothetical protein
MYFEIFEFKKESLKSDSWIKIVTHSDVIPALKT